MKRGQVEHEEGRQLPVAAVIDASLEAVKVDGEREAILGNARLDLLRGSDVIAVGF